MSKLYFATSNEKKIQEAKHILNFPLEIFPIELPEIQELDIEIIVKQKVRDAYEKVKYPVIVDDVGVYINAWNGFPGPLIKYIITAGGNALILKMLGEEKNRKAEFVSAIGYYDGNILKTFIGKVTGNLILKEKDLDSKLVDSIFIPDGADKTYREMSLEEKAAISHRRKSLEMLKQFLSESKLHFS